MTIIKIVFQPAIKRAAEHGEQIMENMGIRMMKARFKNKLTIKEAAEKLG